MRPIESLTVLVLQINEFVLCGLTQDLRHFPLFNRSVTRTLRANGVWQLPSLSETKLQRRTSTARGGIADDGACHRPAPGAIAKCYPLTIQIEWGESAASRAPY